MNPIIRDTVVAVCSSPCTPEALRTALAHYLATGDYSKVATVQSRTGGTFSPSYVLLTKAIETLPWAWRRIANMILWMQQGATTVARTAFSQTVKEILADAEKNPDDFREMP